MTISSSLNPNSDISFSSRVKISGNARSDSASDSPHVGSAGQAIDASRVALNGFSAETPWSRNT